MSRLTRVLLGVTVAAAGILAVSSFQTGAAPAAEAEWPQWRGPNRTAISDEKGLLKQWGEGGPALAWKASGVGQGFSSLAISGGKIFTMGDLGNDQYVFGLNQANGAILWKTKVGAAWHDEFPGPRGTPTVDGMMVYAIGTEGDLVCLDAATGQEKWRRNLPREFGGMMMSDWKYSESPLVDGAKLVFTPGGSSALLAAVDKKTGKDIWRTAAPSLGSRGRDGAGYAGIVVSEGAGVRQYVQMVGRGLVGVRASDGKLLWGYNRIANDVANIPTAIVQGDFVFGSTGYQAGGALVKLTKTADGVKADEVYFLDSKVFQNHHGGMVLVGGYIYAGHGHNRGFPICIEFSTGRVVWGGDIRNGGSGSAAVAYADGNLYFRYQNGVVKLIEASPGGYKEKGSFEIPGANLSWSHPAIAAGKLYLRERDTLYAHNLK
jgi:outer membrane protein assembly factor BamB